MEPAERKELEALAKEIRKLTIDEIGFLGVGHIGGSMSVIEALSVIYHRHLRYDPKNPNKADRDRFVMSKGHAGPAVYAMLAHKGFFPQDWLHTLNVGGTNLPSHCDRTKTPGIDMSTGSLGQGFSAACGIALGQRMDKNGTRTYCIIGDGESNEGIIWEAAMTAAHYKLDNLIAFTDNNKMQIDGVTKDIMSMDRLLERWTSFGWNTVEVDGHNVEAIDRAVTEAKAHQGQPSMIILDTIKGKGCSFCEGKVESHNLAYTMDQVREALAALN